MDFDVIAKNAGLPLVNGELSGLEKAFCFFPKSDEGHMLIGQTLMGKVTGIQRTKENSIVLQVSSPNVIPGKILALRYFHEAEAEVAIGTVPAPGWYLQATDFWDTSSVTYYIGRLKWA